MTDNPLDRPSDAVYDLLVVGAGIYGCWTACHAAQRGLRVLLVDQGDVGSGTSMASSKLIHGGLRYLETGDLRLVRKALKERQVLYEMFPHLVHPIRFRVPLGKRCRWSPLTLKAGLWVYDLLAMGCKDFSNHEYDKTKGEVDGLSKENLSKGSYLYSDGQTDDARLCLSIVQKMMESGGELLTYHRVSDVIQNEQGSFGVKLTKVLECHEQPFEQPCRAKQVFYATGAQLSDHHELSGALRKTRGIHLVFKKKFDHGAVLLHSSVDGRVFFMLPWYGRTIVGTTDIDVPSAAQHADCSTEEVQYLYDSINPYLSSPFGKDDLQGAFAGLRVMRKHDGKASDNTRDWKAVQLDNGTWASLGGKITSARQDTEAWVRAQYGVTLNSMNPLVRPFKAEGDNTLQEHDDLWSRYGQHFDRIKCMMTQYPEELSKIHEDLPFLWLEIRYIVKYEFVKTIEDVLRRRMPLMILVEIDDEMLLRVIEIIQEELGWDTERCLMERRRFVAKLESSGSPRSEG